MAAALRNASVMFVPILRSPLNTFCRVTAVRSNTSKIAAKVGALTAKKANMEVETDPEKLLKYCCGANIFIDGKDPELKPDSEYPEWLWTLHTKFGGQDLSTLDPNTPQYWSRLSRMTAARNKKIWKRLQDLKAIQFPNDQ